MRCWNAVQAGSGNTLGWEMTSRVNLEYLFILEL